MTTKPAMPRMQKIVLPLLREGFGEDVLVTSWIPSVSDRDYPLVNVHGSGGVSNQNRFLLKHVNVTLTCISDVSHIEADDLYNRSIDILWEAVDRQTLTDSGYLHSLTEDMGATQSPPMYEDTWLVEGLIQVGIRPLRNKE